MRLLDLLGMFTAMFLSELLMHNILFGGAVYVSGEAWVIYARLFNKKNLGLLPSNIRVRGLFIFIVAGALTTALVLLFPYIQAELTCLALTLLIIGFLMQQIFTDLAARRLPRVRPRRRALLLASCHAGFLAAYPVFFLLNQWVLGYPVPPEIGAAYVAIVLISALLYVCQLYEQPERPALPPPEAQPLPDDALLQIRAYRLYNRMTTSTLFAINLSITAFICYMRFLPYQGFLSSMIMLSVWLAFTGLITAGGFSLLKKRYVPRYDRHAIFFMGLVFWGVAVFGALFSSWGGTLVGTLLNTAALGMSLACMLSIILAQSYEMQTVIELGLGDSDHAAYARNTEVMLDWSMLTSYLLLLVMLSIAAFLMNGRFDEIEAIEGMRELLRVTMLVLPMGFMLAGLVYSMRQPLDRHYAQKLDKYSRQRAMGEDNPPMERRLKKVLVSDYPRKLALLFLKPLLRPFFPCKIDGQELVDASKGPVVFLCNHLEIYGPVIAVLYSPFPIRPWVISGMLDLDTILEQTRSGAAKIFPFLSERWRTRLVKTLAPFVLWVMQSTDPIPVRRDSLRGAIQMVMDSVEAMEYDDNILIFPETDYKAEGVGTLFAGFVQLGKTYYQRTGRRANFCPMYINKKEKRMSFGACVAFDPENESVDERDRLVNHLQGAMQAMADAPPPPAKRRRPGKDAGQTLAQ